MEKREVETKEIHVTRQASSSNCSHTDWIPFDLTREILVRLPAKSLMRFRCVSKQWASLTSDKDFINSFTTRSQERSCLLLNFQKNDKQVFVSLSQHKNLETCLPHVEDYHLTLKKEDRYKPCFQFQSVHGLVSFHYLTHIVVWNPSVGEYATFQKPDRPTMTKSYLGYDIPIGNTYKLLSMSYSCTDQTHVLTLGVQESWRRITDIPGGSFPCKGICINGVLYYIVGNGVSKEIVSFDVRTEKFKLIQTQSCMQYYVKNNKLSLVSYKGRLAWVILESLFYKLWVLEDAEKEEWSCQEFCSPYSPYDPIAKVDCFLSGVTDDGEFVYVSVSWQDKEIHVSYYDTKRNSYRRIKIKRFEDNDQFWLRSNGCGDDWEFIGSMPNHIENLMSIENFTCLPCLCV